MVKPDDRVRIDGRKVGQSRRWGVVVSVNGALITVHWDDGTTSTFVPSAGDLTVVDPQEGAPARPR